MISCFKARLLPRAPGKTSETRNVCSVANMVW
jgi:hypothetical protein